MKFLAISSKGFVDIVKLLNSYKKTKSLKDATDLANMLLEELGYNSEVIVECNFIKEELNGKVTD